ncbi:MAG: sigma-70 family RNA polymerase sigma factor [Rhodanobacteraceae bacterium]|nr:sigma-70 family RNA polymerase sigma factor [Rhodanobacteraceae bacterium]HPF73481.1 sigma-70 family RNA polymerase sigma factor [Xanthomonadaceae bacterium]HRY00935.1 sigma-70 family RNA polymerase sigma factor [Xanthomonadaceae bacterium]
MNGEALDQLINQQLPLAQSGDQRAFGRIVAACQGGISAIALAMVRDVPVSEDIAQDAFIKAWRKLPQLNQSSSFLPWLRQITRNLARDHLRAKKRERTGGDFDVALATVADPGLGHADRMNRQQETEVLAELLDELPEDTRELLLIYYREGQSSQQVAELLGIRDAAVRKRLSRARQSLRDDLLTRLGEMAKASAPGVAFTALIVAGLSVSAPAAAAGLASGAGAAGKGFGRLAAGSENFGRMLAKMAPKFAPKLAMGAEAASRTAPKFLIGVAGGVVFALVAGLASVFFGLRRYWITAIDAEERRGLLRFGLAGSLLVFCFCGMMLAAAIHDSNAMVSVGFVGLIAGLGLMNLYWLPRVLHRRHAMEHRVDAKLAMQARRDERRNAWVGIVIGAMVGGAGLLMGLIGNGTV